MKNGNARTHNNNVHAIKEKDDADYGKANELKMIGPKIMNNNTPVSPIPVT